MIGFFCPYCKMALQLPDDQGEATTVECPQCKLPVKVPPKPAAPTAATAPRAAAAGTTRSRWWRRIFGHSG